MFAVRTEAKPQYWLVTVLIMLATVSTWTRHMQFWNNHYLYKFYYLWNTWQQSSSSST